MHLIKLLPCLLILPHLLLAYLESISHGINHNPSLAQGQYVPYRHFKEKKGEHRLNRLTRVNYKTWDYPIHLWLHQFPRVKYVEGLHMHSYYTAGNDQKLLGFAKKSSPSAYYRNNEEQWYPHPDIHNYILGKQNNEGGDKSPDESYADDPNMWDKFESTTVSQNQYVYTNIFGRRRRRRRSIKAAGGQLQNGLK